MIRIQSLLLMTAAAAGLSGCAGTKAVDPQAELPHCQTTNKGKPIACTSWPVPSAIADTEAKRFEPDPEALTVYVVRRNWGDSRNFVTVAVDDGREVETLPNTMVRFKLAPGTHAISFEFGGRKQSTTVQGVAGDLRFFRIEGMVWSWSSSYSWASEAEASIQDRALKTRLVADVPMR